MRPELVLIGAPSSAGAYAPGQEKAPAALREARLVEKLLSRGIATDDWGDTSFFRWTADRECPRAMNVEAVARIASEVAEAVGSAFNAGHRVLVLGGDCTVEIGTAAAAAGDASVGLIYMDLDCDMNTPRTTADGALDWMGVAHLLALEGTEERLTRKYGTTPILQPDEVLLFAHRNVKPCEREVIDRLGICEIGGDEVAADPAAAAHRAVEWGRRFDRLVVHFDADVVDYEDFPLAENTRRKFGLSFSIAMDALEGLLRAQNLAALTVTEVNPDHGEPDTIEIFADRLAAALAGSAGSDGKN